MTSRDQRAEGGGGPSSRNMQFTKVEELSENEANPVLIGLQDFKADCSNNVRIKLSSVQQYWAFFRLRSNDPILKCRGLW